MKNNIDINFAPLAIVLLILGGYFLGIKEKELCINNGGIYSVEERWFYDKHNCNYED